MALSDRGSAPDTVFPSVKLQHSVAAVPHPRTAVRGDLVRLRRRAWILLLPICFALYSWSFNGFPILEQKHSVLAEADAANFVILIQDFSLTQKYGDEYNANDRSLGDIAQKHKIHHVPYALVGGAAHDLLRVVFRGIGIPGHQAVYSVNALVAVLNLALLFLLLQRFNPLRNPVFPFLLFYAIALSTWIYSSIPESWPFSATLVMGWLLLLRSTPVRPMAVGVALGAVMLNNVLLAVLAVLMIVYFARIGSGGWTLIRRTVIAGGAALGSWLAGLFILSLFDGSFRPDRFLRYTLWYEDFTKGNFLPPYHPYAWKSAGSNLFINSVVSNQPDPTIPQEALLATLQGSPLGLAATAAYLLIVGVAGAGLFWTLVRGARSGGWRGVLAEESLDLVLWCAVMLGVTVVVFYPAGFLYSAVVVPVILVLLCRHLDLRTKWQQALLYAALALILINNTSQVLQFRDALRALS